MLTRLRQYLNTHDLDFLKYKRLAYGLAILSSCLIIFYIANYQFNYGIDFNGGVVIEIRTEHDIAKIRQTLAPEIATDLNIHLADQQDIIIRAGIPNNQDTQALANQIQQSLASLATDAKPLEYRRIEMIGPQIGKELIMQSLFAVICGYLAVMLYLWLRFEWQYGAAAVLALIFDSISSLGFISLSNIEFNLSTIAALLTIIGYSVNDSVVIYDRIRENKRIHKQWPLPKLINLSLQQTITRTLLTSLTTLLATVILSLFGGVVIQQFANIIIFGIIIGTLSSIFLAAPLLIELKPYN